MMETDLANAWLAAIIESSDDAIISKDLNGVIRTFNPAAERMFGWTASEAIGQSITILIPPERLEEESMIIGRIRKGERVDHYETVRITRDGRRLDLSLTISPIRDAEGRVIAASKIARDVTDRKRQAALLAEQQEWFRVALNSIGDGVIASDVDGRVSFLNHVAERLTGWSLEQARGVPLERVFQIVNEDTREPVENPAARVMRVGHVVGLANHTVLISRRGTEWPIADSAAPIIAEDGSILGVVLAFREITEQRRNDLRVRETTVERERLLVSERNARGDAERANRIKDEFLAVISHELRTPLNAILGWTDLLRRQSSDPALLGHGLDVIGRNTRMQAQLISDLLDVSRIVSGKLQLSLEYVDLHQVVDDSIDALQPAATEKDITIATRYDGARRALVGDAARLQQVVWNLLSNAIKFSPRNEEVTVTVRTLDEHEQIEVADRGAGIRPDQLSSIFDRFQQGSSASTRVHGGLGLGLSIARHLVELHGGTIRAASPGEGLGATFTVTLPLRLHLPAAAGVAPVEAVDDHVSLADVVVLVVEDDRDTRELVRRVLESHAARVLEAESADEALEWLGRPDCPDVIVSDIGLPGVNGYELIARVRRMSEPARSVPAVALTAFARSEDRTHALRAGFNAHVAKPVEPFELVATVRSFANLTRRT